MMYISTIKKFAVLAAMGIIAIGATGCGDASATVTTTNRSNTANASPVYFEKATEESRNESSAVPVEGTAASEEATEVVTYDFPRTYPAKENLGDYDVFVWINQGFCFKKGELDEEGFRKWLIDNGYELSHFCELIDNGTRYTDESGATFVVLGDVFYMYGVSLFDCTGMSYDRLVTSAGGPANMGDIDSDDYYECQYGIFKANF